MNKNIEEKYIINTKNKENFSIIENNVNANIFPLDMLRDIDYIDPKKFR